jgi:hypothetical protein
LKVHGEDIIVKELNLSNDEEFYIALAVGYADPSLPPPVRPRKDDNFRFIE